MTDPWLPYTYTLAKQACTICMGVLDILMSCLQDTVAICGLYVYRHLAIYNHALSHGSVELLHTLVRLSVLLEFFYDIH